MCIWSNKLVRQVKVLSNEILSRYENFHTEIQHIQDVLVFALKPLPQTWSLGYNVIEWIHYIIHYEDMLIPTAGHGPWGPMSDSQPYMVHMVQI